MYALKPNVPSIPSTISPIAVGFIGTFVRYAATKNHPHVYAAVLPKHAFVNVNSPPAFGNLGTIYASDLTVFLTPLTLLHYY